MPATQLQAFTEFCEEAVGRSFQDHGDFQDFSTSDWRRFWGLFLEWSDPIVEGSADRVCVGDDCERAVFFPDLRLNYAENLLRVDSSIDDDAPAVVARHGSEPADRVSRAELRRRVVSVASHLRELGIGPGDRVIAISRNSIEIVVGALATAAVGAAFSSASDDMGAPALLSRFEQLEPELLFANLDDSGMVTPTSLRERIGEVVRALPSLKTVIALDDAPAPAGLDVRLDRLSELIESDPAEPFEWARFAFNIPLFILFSSGTTGMPKGIVHGVGGTLLEHLKEHRLHVDLCPREKLFFHTSAAWMMWHWQLGALASGAELVLYDGPLNGPETLWTVVSDEDVNVFGTGPPYLQLCEDSAFSPVDNLPLGSLRAVLSTGSILHDWQYDWVRDHVGEIPLQSISGGSDIIGCFVLGHPSLPVNRGWIQCRSLAMDVRARQTDSSPPGAGELVCANPFPSRPIGLLGDDGSAFHDAYFAQHPGYWTHGDLIEFDAMGQARMHGRSDGVLNVRGIRIGPPEIYRALGEVAEVREAMVIQHDDPGMPGASQMVLLVVLAGDADLDGRLMVEIRREIARAASASHVPDLIVAVDELPTTHSGKRSERAARDALEGGTVANASALANPSSLALIREAVTQASERRADLAGGDLVGPAGSTEARLVAIWESVLGVFPLKADDDFFELGGTSLNAVTLVQAVHDQLGVDLAPSTLVRKSTPAALAAFIDHPAEHDAPLLVLLREGVGKRPLFLLHPVAGDVLQLRGLALRLTTDRSVYGIQARGLDPSQEPQTRVEDMAATYVEAIQSVQPTGPYALGGYSLGALIAFEMARQLSEDGEEVEWLGMIDPEVHHACLPPRLRWGFRLTESFRMLKWALGDPRNRLPNLVRTAVARAAPWTRVSPPPPEPPLPPLSAEVRDLGLEAFRNYRPRPYRGGATFFKASERRRGGCDPMPVWHRVFLGPISLERFSGDHDDALSGSNVDWVAAWISEHVNRLDRRRA